MIISKQNGLESGFAALAVMLVVAGVGAAAVLGGFGMRLMQSGKVVEFEQVELELARQGFSEAQVEGSTLVMPVLGVSQLADGSFSVFQVVDGRVEEGEYSSEVRVLFPNSEFGLDYYNGSIDEFYLKNGLVAKGTILDRMVVSLEVPGVGSYAARLTDAQVVGGELVGSVAGETFQPGYKFVGRMSDGKLVDVELVESSEEISRTAYLLAQQALAFGGMINGNESGGGGKSLSMLRVKGVTDESGILEFPDELVSAVVDEETGVWRMGGLAVTGGAAGSSLATAGPVIQGGNGVNVAYGPGVVTITVDATVTTVASQDGTVTGLSLTAGSVNTVHLADKAVTAAKLADGVGGTPDDNSVTSVKIKDGEVKGADIEDGAINSVRIEDNSITTGDLIATLNFDDGDILDLSAIDHSNGTEMGLLLPNVSSATPSSPATGEGYIAYDTVGNQALVFNGTSWEAVGGGVTLTTSGASGVAFSNSGLELISEELTLLKGCTDGQLLKWDDVTDFRWECQNDNNSGGATALDGLQAATTDDAAVQSGDDTIIWEWGLTSATSKAFTIGESAASTGGSGDQHLLRITTDATSTAGPLEITSNSADGGDIEINLNSDGDFEIQDAGTAFVTFTDSGTMIVDSLTFDGTSLSSSGTIDITPASASDLDVDVAGGGEIQFDGGLVDIGTGTYVLANGDNDLGVAGDLEVLGAASISGQLTLFGTPVIQSTAFQSLTLGGSTTGDILLQPSGDTGDYFRFVSDGTNLTLATTGGSNLSLTPAGSLTINSGGTTDIQDAVTADSLTLDTGALAVNNSGGITSDQATLVINAGGAVDVQDALNADSITSDAGITVAAAEGLDTAGAGALELGKANATSIDLCNSAACDTINIGNLATVDADSILIGDSLDTLTLTSDTLSLTDDNWSVTAAGVASFITASSIGSQTFTTNNIADSGALTIESATSNALTLNSGSTGDVLIGTDTDAETINLGTGGGAKTVVLGSSNTTSTTTINSGSGNINLVPVDNAHILAANNAGGDSVLWIDQTGSGDIFTASASGTTVLALENDGDLRVDGVFSFGDITPGTAAYNSIGTGVSDVGAVTDGDDLYITGDLEVDGTITVASCTGCGGGGGTLQQAYDAGATILTDATGNIVFQTIGGATDTQFQVNAASAPEIDMVLISNAAQGTVTDGINGLQIDFVTGDGTNPVNAGIEVNLTSGGTASGDIIYGLNLTMDAADASTQTAINIGANFDNGIVGTTFGSNIFSFTNASLTSAGALTVTSCSGCGGGGGSSNWTLSDANGTLSPNNNTLDILIGGTATTSAKFAFLNVAGGTPTASVSGNLTLDAVGEIQTTKNQTLTIGGATTGNVAVVDNLNATAGIDVTGANFTVGGANFSVAVAGGNLITAGILTAGSGSEVLTLSTGKIDADAITLFGGDNDGVTVQSGSGLEVDTNGLTLLQGCGDNEILKWDEGDDDWNCEPDNDTGGGGGGGGNWTLSASGMLYPINQTLDVFIGATSTGSAEIAFININDGATGTPIIQSNDALTIRSGGATNALTLNTENVTSANSGAIAISSGTTTTSGNSGAITIDAGTAVGTAGTITIGGTEAAAVVVGSGSNTLQIATSNWDVSSAGAISGVTTLGLSGAIAGATATDTINGIIINSSAVSSVTTLGLSGAISGATATDTINGLIINSGALSGVTGYTQASGDFDVTLDTTADASLTKTGAAATSGVGLEMNFTAAAGDGADVYRALVLDVASANHAASTDEVIALDIDALASADTEGVETAIRIGTGWDFDLAFDDTSPTISIGGGGTLTINDGGNTLMTLADSGSDGTLTVATINGSTALQVGGADINTGGTLSNVAYLDAGQTFTGANIFTPGTTTDFVVNVDADSNIQFTAGAAPAVDMVVISNTGQGTTTNDVNGLQVDFVTGDGTNPINAGIEVNLTSGGTAAGDIIYGLELTMDAADASTQTAINIGANFDNGISGTTFGANIFDFTSFDVTSAGLTTIAGTAASNSLSITAGDALLSDGSLTIVDADDTAATLSVTNNAATTTGVGAAGAVNVLASTSLTTGDLLELQLTEGTLTTGNYLTAWDVTAGASVFEIGEDGIVTAGTGAEVLTLATGKIDADAIGLITADGAGLTSSGSGLETDTDRLGLLQGCGAGQILEWNDGSNVWACGNDDSGGGGGGGNWTLNSNGTLYPINATLDVLVGGTSTASATFAFMNVEAGTPTASASAGTSGSAFFTAAGNFASTQLQSLTLGGATTGDVLIQPSADTDDYFSFTSDATNLTLATTGGSNLSLTPAGSLTINSGGTTDIQDAVTADSLTLDTGALAVNNAGGITSDQATLVINAGGAVDVQDALTADSITSDAGVSIAAGNSYTGAGAVTVSSTTTNALTLDSGTTGTVNLGTSNNAKTINVGTGTAGNTINVGTNNTTLDTINIGSALDNVAITGDDWSVTNAGALTVTSCSGCGGGGGSSNWTLSDANGTLSPNNNTLDILIGNTATTSAEIAFINIDDGAASNPTIISNDALTIRSGGATNALTLNTENVTSANSGAIAISSGTTTTSGNSGNITIDSGTAVGTAGTITIGGTEASAVTIGSGTNTFTIATSNWDVTSGGAFSGLDTIGLSGAITGATATDTINGIIINSSAVSSVTTLATTGGWTQTGASPSITIDAASTLSVSNGTDTFSINTSTNTLNFDDGSGNSFVFDVDAGTGPVYAGLARPPIKWVLSPEYAGATLTASSSATAVGTMTADASPSAEFRNWYEWDSSETSLNDYVVAVRVTLPSDFAAWATTNAIQVNFNTELTTTDTNKLDVFVYNTIDTPADVVDQKIDQASGTEKTWTTVTMDDANLDDGVAPDWDAAGETAVIYLKMYSKDNNYTQVGEIVLNYLAKF